MDIKHNNITYQLERVTQTNRVMLLPTAAVLVCAGAHYERFVMPPH